MLRIAVRLVRGETSRDKLLELTGDAHGLRERYNELLR
jgi:hypothetical protein